MGLRRICDSLDTFLDQAEKMGQRFTLKGYDKKKIAEVKEMNRSHLIKDKIKDKIRQLLQ